MSELVNYKMIISYLGTNYRGWQTQKKGNSIQEQLENILEKIFKERVKLKYSSRTDAGVHAHHQVANFIQINKMEPSRLRFAINTQIPEDIVVKNIELVDMSFDARRAVKKTYKYLIDIAPTRSPFRMYRYFRPKTDLDVTKIKEAIPFFIGVKDYKSFMAVDGCAKTTVRTIYDFHLTEYKDKLVFTITGSGFLKQMVRNIVGTILEVAKGRIEVEDIENIFKSCDRRSAGPTAPGYGLYLHKVFYEE